MPGLVLPMVRVATVQAAPVFVDLAAVDTRRHTPPRAGPGASRDR